MRWRSNIAGRQFLYSSLDFLPIAVFFPIRFCRGSVASDTLTVSPPDQSGLLTGLYSFTPATPATPHALYLLLPNLKQICIFYKLFLSSTVVVVLGFQVVVVSHVVVVVGAGVVVVVVGAFQVVVVSHLVVVVVHFFGVVVVFCS